MRVKTGSDTSKFAGLASKFESFMNARFPKSATQGLEVEIGLAKDGDFPVPAEAINTAAYVGDSKENVAGPEKMIASDEVKALFKQNPRAVDTRFVWDESMRKFRMVATKRRFVADQAVADAAPDLMAAQALSPWNIGWFEEIFKQPLLYSHFDDVVQTRTGTEPWCDVMNMNVADFSGFGVLEDTGRLSNNATMDVNVQSGLMSSPVIHLSASYSLSVEEVKRAEQSGSPFGSQLITAKQRYCDYSLHMLHSMLGYYGNVPTETVGLLGAGGAVNVYGGTSMNGIFLAGGAHMGSDMLSALQNITVPFLDSLYNKPDTLYIIMSQICYNRLTAPYSQLYEYASGLKAFKENFVAGLTKSGSVPNVEIIVDPLMSPTNALNGTNPMNANAFDYLILAAPRLRTGPEDTSQDMLLFGAPLKRFAFPVIPGSYNTQYKFLERAAGVFCPVSAVVRAYSGFGCLTAAS